MQNAVKKSNPCVQTEAGIAPIEEESERVREANRKWSDAYRELGHKANNATSTSNCDISDNSNKVVDFAPEEAWSYIYENPEEASDLREARTSDHKTRQADKKRMNDMMEKVFDPQHRKNMFKIIFGEELWMNEFEETKSGKNTSTSMGVQVALPSYPV